MNKIRITSDGTPFGTKVFACNRDNGVDVELNNIIEIEFSPISIKRLIPSVKITFAMPEIDVLADLESPKNV